jgi:hypothetical protein
VLDGTVAQGGVAAEYCVTLYITLPLGTSARVENLAEVFRGSVRNGVTQRSAGASFSTAVLPERRSV